ncbi:MAG: hypothetical protein ACYTGB_16315 [Planctomycetota bacterium]
MRLPRAGSYGLALSAVDSVGIEHKPPRRGTRQAFEISTDKVPPVLEALKWVKKGQVVSARKGIEIEWKATDKNIGPKPVSVEFSSNAGRNWQAVGMNREAAGKLTWTAPDRIDSRRCLLRLVARDLLGNESQLTSSPFTVDNKPPVTNSRFERVEPGAEKPKPVEGPVPLKPAPKKGRR